MRPRVVVLLEQPEWPPFLDETRPYVSGGEPSPLEVPGQSQVVEESREFVESADKDKLLWFKVRGVLVNEGVGTARVRVGPHNVRFVTGNALGFVHIPAPARVGPVGNHEYRLSPGAVALFEWGDGKSVGDWINSGDEAMYPLQITTWAFDNSTIDITYVKMSGRPLVRGPRPDSWFLSTPDSAGTYVYETQRLYGANAPMPPAPWVEEKPG